MNLHRAETKPGWELVAPEERNRWQKVAAQSKGIITPGNIATAAGIGLVVAGSREVKRGNYGRGIVSIAAGFAMDFVDGWGAEKTGTKSRLGAYFDIFADKAKVAITSHALTSAGLVSPRTTTHILVQNGANVAITGYAKLTGNTDFKDASEAGKSTAVAQAGTMISQATANALHQNGNHEVLANAIETVAKGLELAAGFLGAKATAGYARAAVAPAEIHPEQ